jgi:hypothetical protein
MEYLDYAVTNWRLVVALAFLFGSVIFVCNMQTVYVNEFIDKERK